MLKLSIFLLTSTILLAGSAVAHAQQTPPSSAKFEAKTSAQQDSVSQKSAAKIDDIKGESQRTSDGGDNSAVSSNPLESTAISPTGCVTFSGAADENCDGEADPAAPATDYNSSRSNKADVIAAPDGDISNGGDGDDNKATDYNSSRSIKNF